MRQVLQLILLLLAVPVCANADSYQDLNIERFNKNVGAPNFSLEDLQGNSIHLSEYEGKVVLLNFWATWCMPCRQEMPGLESLWQRYKDKGLVVIGVSNDDADKHERVANFVKKVGLSFPIALDAESNVSHLYEVSGIPASYLIDRKGVAIARILGERDWGGREASAVIEDLLSP